MNNEPIVNFTNPLSTFLTEEESKQNSTKIHSIKNFEENKHKSFPLSNLLTDILSLLLCLI